MIKRMKKEERDELAKARAEEEAVRKENKLLSFLLPIVGAFAFILGLVGFILTINSGLIGVTIFYAILFAVGLLGILYGVLLIIRTKKPDFLKKKKEAEEDTVLAD